MACKNDSCQRLLKIEKVNISKHNTASNLDLCLKLSKVGTIRQIATLCE